MNVGEWCEIEKNAANVFIWQWAVLKGTNRDEYVNGGFVLVNEGESLEDIFSHICFLAKLNRSEFADPWEGGCSGDFSCGKKDDPMCYGDFMVSFGSIDVPVVAVNCDLMELELAEGEEHHVGWFEKMKLECEQLRATNSNGNK